MIPIKDNIPNKKFPLVNYVLITINIIVFIYQIKLMDVDKLQEFIYRYSVVPFNLLEDFFGDIRTLITAQFVHGGFSHILGNMIYLYIFGTNVESKLGHTRYFLFYLLCGIVSLITQIYIAPTSRLPLLGASGAIAGVLGAYFLFYPKAKIMTLIPLGFFIRTIEIPAFLFIGFWFLLQVFSGNESLMISRMAGHEVGGVAWFAHIGGFIFGLMMAIYFKLVQ